MEPFEIRFRDLVERHAAVHFESLCGGHQHRECGLESGLSALDVVEFLRPQVGAESGFGDDVVGVREGHFCRHDRVAPVGDVGKGSAVHEGRRVFCGLHQVGFECIFEEHHDTARHAEIFHREGRTVESVTEENVLNASAQVGFVGRQTEDGHEFAGGGDVEARLRGDAVDRGAESGDDAAERTVVDVEHASPEYFFESEALGAMLVEVVVEQGRDHVVRGGDGVEVAGEVEIDLLHGQHLGVSAAGCSAFHAEAGAERGFAQGNDRFAADAVESEGESDRNRGLADTGAGGRDRGHEDEATFVRLRFVDEAQGHFRNVFAVLFQVVFVDADLGGDIADGEQRCGVCNFEVGHGGMGERGGRIRQKCAVVTKKLGRTAVQKYEKSATHVGVLCSNSRR